MTKYKITKNEQFNSCEISFDGKPSEQIREALKAMRFRWHGVKKVWYGFRTEGEVREAIESAENGKPAAHEAEAVKHKAEKEKPANLFGVKVGDLFYASWGYEQTNVDFFQVIELVGKTSVRVREVNPPIVEDKTYPHGMAADRSYQVKDCGILPAAPRSVFIKDQEKGDLKRIKSYAADGKSNPQFNLSSFADASLCTGNIQKCYESWYY